MVKLVLQLANFKWRRGGEGGRKEGKVEGKGRREGGKSHNKNKL